MLNNHSREQLIFIIQQYGRNIVNEPLRCRGLLSDLAPEYKRENNLLMAVLEQKLAKELLTPSALISIDMQLDGLAQRLHDNLGIKEEFAIWAVESWALALNVIQKTGVQNEKPSIVKSWTLALDVIQKQITKNSVQQPVVKNTIQQPAIQSAKQQTVDNKKDLESVLSRKVITPTPAKVITPAPTQQQIGKFIVKDGIAIDTQTNLMWLRFAHGQKWQNNTVVGKADLVNWHYAREVAKQFNRQGGYAGYTNWRLPSIDELKKLIDRVKGKSGNYIDSDVFINSKGENGNRYWSASPSTNYYDYSGKAAEFVDFNSYDVSEYWMSSEYCVRFVHHR